MLTKLDPKYKKWGDPTCKGEEVFENPTSSIQTSFDKFPSFSYNWFSWPCYVQSGFMYTKRFTIVAKTSSSVFYDIFGLCSHLKSNQSWLSLYTNHYINYIRFSYDSMKDYTSMPMNFKFKDFRSVGQVATLKPRNACVKKHDNLCHYIQQKGFL